MRKMPYRIVQSKQNPRLKELRLALERPERISRGELPLAGIEGPKLLAEAMRAGLRIATVFVAQEEQSLLHALRLPPQTEILLVPRALLSSVLATETPQPIAALVEPPEWSWPHLLNSRLDVQHPTALLVILAGLQDPGNLGTILRSAEAFGASGIICLPGTVSPWNPKAVRASAGSVFRLPCLAVTESVALERLREAGVRLFATTVHTAQPADLADLAGPVALLIGNEGSGLPADLAEKADAALTIPCPGPVESLNAAVATSVLLYEAARQRGIGNSGQSVLRGVRQ